MTTSRENGAASRSRWLRMGLLAVLAAGLAVLYVDGALRHADRVNTSLENTDQASYLERAINLRENRSGYVDDRNQMPLYPFLFSLVYDPEESTDQAFARGKTFNIILSLFLLGALLLIWRRHFPPLQTGALLLVTGFTVFVFRAGYLQVELLYYVMFFGGFLLMARMLEAPSWPLAAVTGFWLALSHLTKASVLPGLMLFLVLGLIKVIWTAVRRSRLEAGPAPPAGPSALRNAAQLGTVVLLFLVTLAPYLRTSKQVFGHAFYNVNSTFYMWYDTWQQAMEGTIAHGDRIGWPRMPEDQIPSARKYLREHTLKNMVDRVRSGLRVLGWSVQTYGYWKYVLFYGAAALLVLVFSWRWSLELARRHVFLVLFGVGILAGYTLLYAWYIPIARGNRLILSLFLPFMFMAGSILVARARAEPAAAGRRWPSWFLAVHLVMIGGIGLELYDILTNRLVSMYAGD